jgi:hypothetical protein
VDESELHAMIDEIDFDGIGAVVRDAFLLIVLRLLS